MCTSEGKILIIIDVVTQNKLNTIKRHEICVNFEVLDVNPRKLTNFVWGNILGLKNMKFVVNLKSSWVWSNPLGGVPGTLAWLIIWPNMFLIYPLFQSSFAAWLMWKSLCGVWSKKRHCLHIAILWPHEGTSGTVWCIVYRVRSGIDAGRQSGRVCQ